MDFNLLIGSLQLAIAAFQLKLNHFPKPSTNDEPVADDLESFYALGEAIRRLEFALSETIDFVGRTNERRANPELAEYWRTASESIKNVKNNADLADLTFEKHLYWRNPEFFQRQGEYKLYRISLDNVLTQLRKLRSEYEKLHRKLNP